MQITQETSGNTTIVAPEGRVDSTTAGDLESALMPLFDQAGSILIDLAGLDYISSAGLRVLLLVAKRSKSTGVKLALSGMQPSVREVFEISGFVQLFALYDDRSEALGALSG